MADDTGNPNQTAKEDGPFPMYLLRGQLLRWGERYFELPEAQTFARCEDLLAYLRERQIPPLPGPPASPTYPIIGIEEPDAGSRSAPGLSGPVGYRVGFTELLRNLFHGRTRVRCRLRWKI